MDKILSMEIYEFMRDRDVSSTFSDSTHKSKYSFNDIETVWREKQRILKEINIVKNGEKVLSEAVYEVNPDTGESICTTPVMYAPKTNTSVLKYVVSDILDVETILVNL
jgi:hypothetical protein